MSRVVFLFALVALVGCQPRDGSTPSKSGKDQTGSTAGRRDQGTNPATMPPGTGQSKESDPGTQIPGKKTKLEEPEQPPKRPPEFEEAKEDPPEDAPPIPKTFKALNKDQTIFFERKADDTRLVHLLAHVCLREGPLEVLLCKKGTKEHESILHMEGDAREIHFALIAAGAMPGSPVKFVPKYTEATGTKIQVSLTYRKNKQVITSPAGAWIKDKKTGKDMAYNWVFAGSKFFKDPENPNATPFYTANNGEFISLANFPDSMLDLPVKSPKDIADLIFEIHTERIPPMGTPVIVTLQPILEKK